MFFFPFPKLASLEISSYILSFLFFLQREQPFSKHSRILWRDRGGGLFLFLAKSFLSFSKCFSYSFESEAFFGWEDIFLPTFALLYICSRIPILVVLEFSRETGPLWFLQVAPFYKPFSSSHSKRQSFCWCPSYTQV